MLTEVDGRSHGRMKSWRNFTEGPVDARKVNRGPADARKNDGS